MTFKTVAKDIGPGNGKTAIGGPERRYRDALRAKGFHPRTIGPEPWPACTAKRQHGCACLDTALSFGSLKQQAAIVIPAGPAMPQRELYPHGVEPPQPRAQQWRGLERLREYPAAGTDEGRLPQRFAPFAQIIWRQCTDRRRKALLRRAVAREKRGQRFAVGQIEPATSGHQKLAARRRHRVKNRDALAGLRQHLSR